MKTTYDFAVVYINYERRNCLYIYELIGNSINDTMESRCSVKSNTKDLTRVRYHDLL